MDKLRTIFMETDPLTNQELERYLSGQMSPEEMHQVEMKMSSNDLYADAVEGFQSTGTGLTGFDQLAQRFEASLNAPGPGGGVAASGSMQFGQMILVCFGLGIITVLGLSSINESLNGGSHEPRIIVVTEQQEDPEPEVEAVEEADEAEVLAEIEEELVTAEPVAEKDVITFERTLENQPQTVASQDDPVPSPNPEPEKDPVTHMGLDSVSTPNVGPVEPNFDPSKTVKSNVKVLFLHDLKVVDYSGLYEKKIRIRNMDVISGTRAYMANKDSLNATPMPSPYIYIEYLDYLDNAMMFFNKNDFKGALKEYKVVLKHYPDDVNALFYGALCYYNLGKPSKAIKYFDKVVKNYINTFDQEGEFYKALSFKLAGQKDKALELLEQIANSHKFYAKRARKEIANINH